MKIEGSVAIVTGGAQGIGEQICRALLERGGKVAAFDIDREKGFQLQDRLEKQYGPGRAMFIACDVASNTQMKDSFNKTKEAFGQINIVCNNAGVMLENEQETWEKVVDVNLKGVILGQFLGILHMGRSFGGAGGAIVNVSSMAAIFPVPAEQSIYSATKHAVLGLTQSSEDLQGKEGIRVNCICPSFTATQMASRAIRIELVKQRNKELSDSYAKLGLVRPELVARGIIQLIEDDSRNASVMLVTTKRGIEMLKSRKPWMRNSKL